MLTQSLRDCAERCGNGVFVGFDHPNGGMAELRYEGCENIWYWRFSRPQIQTLLGMSAPPRRVDDHDQCLNCVWQARRVKLLPGTAPHLPRTCDQREIVGGQPRDERISINPKAVICAQRSRDVI